MQYGAAFGTRSRYARLRSEGLYFVTVRSDAVWGCIRDTLPLTSPCSGTKRKTAVPLFFASTGGLRLSLLQPHTAIASTHCLYSPSLRRLFSIGG